MKHHLSSRIPQAPIRVLQRIRIGGDDTLLREVADLTARGVEVRIQRYRAPWFSIVANQPLYLVRPNTGDPIASCVTVAEAVAAGDRWAKAADREEDDDDGPRGAA